MDLGEALYRGICQRSPNTEPRDFAGAVRWFIRQAGSVAGAARLAGVPRRTFRDWATGKSKAKGERASGIIRAAIKGERRRRLKPGREARLRATDPGDMVLSGSYNYDGYHRGKVAIGRFLPDDAMDSIIDGFLAGQSIDRMREEFALRIDDPANFYDRTLKLPTDDPHGWTITQLRWGADGRDEL